MLKYEAMVAQSDSSHTLLGADWSSPATPYQSPQNQFIMEEHLSLGPWLQQAGEEPRVKFVSPDGQSISFHRRCGETDVLTWTGTGPLAVPGFNQHKSLLLSNLGSFRCFGELLCFRCLPFLLQ